VAGYALGLVDQQNRGGARRQQAVQHGEPPGHLAHVDVAPELCHSHARGGRAIGTEDAVRIRFLCCLATETGRRHGDLGVGQAGRIEYLQAVLSALPRASSLAPPPLYQPYAPFDATAIARGRFATWKSA
jgi:hypothetical protein